MKGFALEGRDKPKDAYDIYFCARNFTGGPIALAEACRPLLREQVAREGYVRIAGKFPSADGFGPHTVSRFLGESGGLEGMRADQIRLDAYSQVRAWLDAMGVVDRS